LGRIARGGSGRMSSELALCAISINNKYKKRSKNYAVNELADFKIELL
jgi:hypothetical protein